MRGVRATGLFDRIFGRNPRRADGASYFQTLTSYTPVFRTSGGKIYEQDLIRAAVDARARHVAKLAFVMTGSGQQRLRSALVGGPNEMMTWSQFLYRTSTILDVNNTAFVVPQVDDMGRITGYFPINPASSELVDVSGEPWIRYRFGPSGVAAIPYKQCAVLTKFQYADDLFGDSNRAIDSTVDLLMAQKQGIEEGIKNGASYRFMARVNNFAKDEDLAKERKKFDRENFTGSGGGVLLFPNRWDDIKQLDYKGYTISADQIKTIQQNVFNYFGVNENILQNKSIGDEWSAFYEGAVEPFAIQLSETMTRMTFSQREQALGNAIMFTANKTQYMTNKDKLSVSTQLVDRGILSRDDAREIWNLPPLPDGQGQAFVIRGEYKSPDEKEGDDA